MENGKPIFYDIESCGRYINKIKDGRKIGIWGIHQDFHEGHKVIAKRINELSDYVIGIYYQNWADWISQINGAVQYQDSPFDSILLNKVAEHSNCVLIFRDEYTLFNGGYGYWLHNLWPRMLKEYPDERLPKELLSGELRRNLYTHFRACQALKIVQNDYIHCDVSIGGKRDAWRWFFKEWQEENYSYVYEMVEPVLNDVGNALSASRPENKVRFDIPLLQSGIDTLEKAQARVDHLGLKCHYLLQIKGYLYAKYSYQNQYWVEGIKI
jgi:hypothetical protein